MKSIGLKQYQTLNITQGNRSIGEFTGRKWNEQCIASARVGGWSGVKARSVGGIQEIRPGGMGGWAGVGACSVFKSMGTMRLKMINFKIFLYYPW